MIPSVFGHSDGFVSDSEEGEGIEGGEQKVKFQLVAGDGACPNAALSNKKRRAGCGLYYGKKHSHNSKWEVTGERQDAQRAELMAAIRWASWAWTSQTYLTDSAMVHRGC